MTDGNHQCYFQLINICLGIIIVREDINCVLLSSYSIIDIYRNYNFLYHLQSQIHPNDAQRKHKQEQDQGVSFSIRWSLFMINVFACSLLNDSFIRSSTDNCAHFVTVLYPLTWMNSCLY